MRFSEMAKIAWELIDLQVLSAVARRSSFTGAAVDLGMSVANVTKRIARLEQALNTTLFLRTTRRVSITTQGETVYLWARKVLEAAEALDQEVASSRDSPVGTLRVSTSHRLGSRHIAPILGLMRQQHPALDLWLELVDRRVDLLAEGLDIDIRVGDVHEPHLVAYPVARSARVLCASPDYLARRGRPTRPEELGGHDVLLFRDRDRPFGMLKLEGPQGAESVQVGGPLGSNQSDAIVQWAQQGLGIALLSQWDVADALRLGHLERVLPLFQQPADIYAVMPVRSSQSLKLHLCLGFLRDHLAQGPHALQVS
jgi:LysR family transcriptional activator of dmlA